MTSKHPIRPVIVDKNNVHRFDMNKLACMNFSNEDREQFAQLIGYSVSGICDLDYVSDRVAFKGLKDSKKLSEGTK